MIFLNCFISCTGFFFFFFNINIKRVYLHIQLAYRISGCGNEYPCCHHEKNSINYFCLNNDQMQVTTMWSLYSLIYISCNYLMKNDSILFILLLDISFWHSFLLEMLTFTFLFSSAYEILSDEEKRKNYDMYGDEKASPRFDAGYS